MYIFGKGVPTEDEIPQSVDTTNMHEVTRSGVYRLLINSTSWRQNIRNDGGTWDSVKLNCVAYTTQGALAGKLNIDVSLNSNKAHQLAYFLSFLNQNGEFFIPSPRHHEGISNKTGKDYCFDSIDELHAKSVYALIEYKGLNEKGYRQYYCVGFCDEKAFSAADLSNHATHRCAKYQHFINSIQAPAASSRAPQGYGQQVKAAYPQQSMQSEYEKQRKRDTEAAYMQPIMQPMINSHQPVQKNIDDDLPF